MPSLCPLRRCSVVDLAGTSSSALMRRSSADRPFDSDWYRLRITSSASSSARSLASSLLSPIAPFASVGLAPREFELDRAYAQHMLVLAIVPAPPYLQSIPERDSRYRRHSAHRGRILTLERGWSSCGQ